MSETAVCNSAWTMDWRRGSNWEKEREREKVEGAEGREGGTEIKMKVRRKHPCYNSHDLRHFINIKLELYF